MTQTTDLLSLYGHASEWTLGKVAAVTDLGARTPCEEWDARTLMNHMLETQQYFVGSARGEDVSPPGPNPPELLGSDPVADFREARDETLRVFGEDGVVEKTFPALGVAFSDQLLHGWDLARASGAEATMPEDLAEAAYQMVHGRFTDDQRKGIFGPEIQVAADASSQDKLLAYTGRTPEGDS